MEVLLKHISPNKKKKHIVVERKLGRERGKKRDGEKGTKVYGQAWKEKGVMEIDPRQKAFQYLDTLIHEKIHLEQPELPEYKVKAISRSISIMLWNLNYRKVILK